MNHDSREPSTTTSPRNNNQRVRSSGLINTPLAIALVILSLSGFLIYQSSSVTRSIGDLIVVQGVSQTVADRGEVTIIFNGDDDDNNDDTQQQPLIRNEQNSVRGSSSTASAADPSLPEQPDNTQSQPQTQPNNHQPSNGFTRYDNVVIATKIHGQKHLNELTQSICLLNKAYNEEMRYDYIVFTTTPLTRDQIDRVEEAASPAKVTIIVDNPGLKAIVEALSEEQQADIVDRCGVNSTSDLTWDTKIFEIGASYNTSTPLGYTWQAEFRSLHIWKHPALAAYKYMMWLDTDGFATKVWDKDPMEVMVENDLVILFDNFPMGRSRGPWFYDRYRKAFNTTLCDIKLTKEGTLRADMGRDCHHPQIPQIHGFFHITNLDFYREDRVMNWARILIGDSKFSRKFDDQIAGEFLL